MDYDFKLDVDSAYDNIKTIKDHSVRRLAFILFKRYYKKRASGISYMKDLDKRELLNYAIQKFSRYD